MYEVTCPHCSQTQTSSFVRSGAVIDCPSCGKRYQIADSHVRHMTPVLAAGDGSELSERSRPAREREPVVSSELHAIAAASASAQTEGASEEDTWPGEDELPLSRVTARRSRRGRNQVMLLWLAASVALVLGVGLAVTAIVLLSGPRGKHEPAVAGPEVNPTSNTPRKTPPPPADADSAPIGEGREASRVRWEMVYGNVSQPASSGPIRVEELGTDFGSQPRQGMIKGKVRAQSGMVYAWVLLDLYLYKDDSMIAEAKYPVYVLSEDSPHDLVLPLPGWVGTIDQQVGWSVASSRRLAGGVCLEQVTCKPERREGSPACRVKAYNSTKQRLGRVGVVLTGRNEAGEVVGRWVATVSHDIWPYAWGQVVVVLPAEASLATSFSGSVVGWSHDRVDDRDPWSIEEGEREPEVTEDGEVEGLSSPGGGDGMDGSAGTGTGAGARTEPASGDGEKAGEGADPVDTDGAAGVDGPDVDGGEAEPVEGDGRDGGSLDGDGDDWPDPAGGDAGGGASTSTADDDDSYHPDDEDDPPAVDGQSPIP